MTHKLTIENLHVSVDDKPILRGVNLVLHEGETHALMGPNGSGKSTLGMAIMGHPKYEVNSGTIKLDDQDVLALSPDERARAGLFMAFQRPVAIPGVKMADFLRHSTTNVRNPNRQEGEDLIPMKEFRKELTDNMNKLEMDVQFARRYVNDGFSGGEMKRAEILQLAMLQPTFAILDETDSGLDVDALRIVGEGVTALRSPERSMLVITHYQRLLDYIVPDVVHVLADGKIVDTGDKNLAIELEKNGYANYSEAAA